MTTCDACREPVSESAKFCPSCGEALVTADSPTVNRGDAISADSPTFHREPRSAGTEAPAGDAFADSPTEHRPSPPRRPASAPSSSSLSSSSSGSFAHGRFLPGQVLGGRFRVIAILGKGGMGEVYRADDLTLGQPVALKFLPETLAGDAERLEKFRAEVRMARQVAHPNVCKVYDIGELDGESFLSMEYVEGEDLAHLLKRIGALPQSKAIQIARQIAAGLAAAHDRGLIHRDLKPANVMLDERGTVRVTDFGLAGTAEDFTKGNVREGTPQYMAPEQLRGESVTARSDLYALGLVMYELFTGRKAFEAPTMAKLIELRESSTSSDLSGSMEGLDPAVERLILRCLEEDPARRPASAMLVAAALPGGDPLAAAIAAGETPSPEMVAAAGDEGRLRTGWAVAALVVTVLTVLLNPFLSRWLGSLAGDAMLEHPPAVLEAKGRDLLARLGYEAKPGDVASSYTGDAGYVRHIRETDQSAERWRRLQVSKYPVVRFWLRESPESLRTFDFFTPGVASSIVSFNDPPLTKPGMVRLTLAPDGRLWGLQVVPDPAAGKLEATSFDFAPALREAGFDPASLTPAEPARLPRSFADERAAWTGTVAGEPPVEVRIEAARLGSKLVSFEIIPSWEEAAAAGPRARRAGELAGLVLQITLFLGALGGSALLARRNLRMGRGDRRGAFRLAVFVILVVLAGWLVQADHVATPGELGLFIIGLSWALFFAATIWVMYVALEPLVRRRWPTMLISWSRLLAGRVTDPLVGRDILVGSAMGALVAVVVRHGAHVASRLGGGPGDGPNVFQLGRLADAPAVCGVFLERIPMSIALGFIAILFLLALRLVLRREWLASGVFVVVLGALTAVGNGGTPAAFAIGFIIWSGVTWMLVRQGILAVVTALVVLEVAVATSATPGALSSWAGVPIWTATILLLALAGWGFHLATRQGTHP
ncbi:MAG: protein kinase domain-containing protein [Thermoanaerobaculia bacterium]